MEKSKLPKKNTLTKKQQLVMFKRTKKYIDKVLKEAGESKDFRKMYFSHTPVGRYLREASFGFLAGKGANEEDLKAILEYLDKN